MQLSSVTTAARQEWGVLPQPPKIRGVCRRIPQPKWQESSQTEAKPRAQFPAADPERGQAVLQCWGWCPAAHHRGTQSCSEPAWEWDILHTLPTWGYKARGLFPFTTRIAALLCSNLCLALEKRQDGNS